MKKCIKLILCIAMLLALCGCTTDLDQSLPLTKIDGYDYLYYDQDTKVVYMAFRQYYGNQGYGYMSPYIAPNGLPYLWDGYNLVQVPEDL